MGPSLNGCRFWVWVPTSLLLFLPLPCGWCILVLPLFNTLSTPVSSRPWATTMLPELKRVYNTDMQLERNPNEVKEHGSFFWFLDRFLFQWNCSFGTHSNHLLLLIKASKSQAPCVMNPRLSSPSLFFSLLSLLIPCPLSYPSLKQVLFWWFLRLIHISIIVYAGQDLT
jgi:hypothetical protein